MLLLAGFKYKTGLTAHAQTHSGQYKYTCTVCQLGFPRKYALDCHNKKIHGLTPRRHVKYSCVTCTQVFSSREILQRHVAHAHQGQRWKCQYCSKEFIRKPDLNAHVQFHTGDFRYYCVVCSEGFARKYRLNLHMARVHNPKSLQCDLCGKSFDYWDTLRNHKEVCGVKVNRFECGVCHKRLKSRSILREHLTLHDPSRATPCQHCGKMFKTRKHARFHERKVHPSSGERSQCSVCKAVLKSRVYLAKHMALHDVSRHVTCTHCDKRFKSKDHLKLHMKNMHKLVYVLNEQQLDGDVVTLEQTYPNTVPDQAQSEVESNEGEARSGIIIRSQTTADAVPEADFMTSAVSSKPHAVIRIKPSNFGIQLAKSCAFDATMQ